MSPFFRDDGSMNPDSPDLTTEPHLTESLTPPPPPSRIGLGPEPPAPAKPKDAAGSDAPPLKPGWPVFTSLEQIEAYRAGIPKDVFHPAHSDFELMSYVADEEYRLSGKPVNEAGEPVDPETGETEEREVFANGQLRTKDAEAEATRMATLPAPPAGHQWDQNTHQALIALGEDTPLTQDAIADGYVVVAQAQEIVSRGVVSDDLTWERPLTEHWGPNHDERVDHAAYALELLAADDEPAIQRAAEWIGALWEWDARVVIFLADRVYPALRDGTPGPLVTEMLMRSGTRWAQGQAAAKARAAKAAKADEMLDDHIVSYGGRP
jgi:hypothetical protein